MGRQRRRQAGAGHRRGSMPAALRDTAPRFGPMFHAQILVVETLRRQRVHTRPGFAEHLTPTSPQNQLGRLVMAACSLVLVSRRAARRAIAVRLFAAVVWGEGALQRHQPSSLRDPRPRKAHARSGGAALPPEDLAGPTAMHAPPLGRQDVRSGTHPIPRRCCSPVRCRYYAAGLAYRRRSPLGQSPVGATGAPPRSIGRTVR